MIKARENLNRIQPYQPGKPIEEVERELGIEKVIKLASNENPLGPSPKAIEAIINNASTVHLYPDSGCYYLTKAIAEYLNRPAEQIIIGNGSDELIFLLCMAYLDEGDEALFGEYAFLKYRLAIESTNATPKAIAMPNLVHNLDLMAEAINEKTKIIFIANPNNPTGTVVWKDEVNKFIKKIPDNIIIVFDEAYYEYINEPNFPNTIKYISHNKPVIVMRTFAKIYGLAGLRVGYAMGKKELLAPIHKIRPTFNVNRLAQVAASAALTDKEHIENSYNLNQQQKAWLEQELTALKLNYVKSYTNFILVKFGPKAQEVYQKLLTEAGIIVRPMKPYGLGEYLRITIGLPEENQALIKALKFFLNN